MRRTETFIVKDDTENRDFGTKFVITEMSAWEGEKLAQELLRVLSLGQKLPDEIVDMGCKGLATLGPAVFAILSPDEGEQLTKRLFRTVKIAHVGPDGSEILRPVEPSDFNEWQTITALKDKIFELNFGFLKRDAK